MSRPLRFQDGPFTAARHRQSRKWPHGHVPVFSQFSQHKGAGPRAGEGQGPRAPLLGPGWAPWGSQPSPGDPRPTAAAPGLDTPGRGSHRIRELGLNPPGGGACPLQERRQGGRGLARTVPPLPPSREPLQGCHVLQGDPGATGSANPCRSGSLIPGQSARVITWGGGEVPSPFLPSGPPLASISPF